MSENFELTLQEHETLNKLIKEKELNTFTKFPSIDNFSSEFIDWLSPQYYETFVYVYDTYTGSKSEAKVVKLINSEWFCNDETKDKIVDLLSTRLEATLTLSKELKDKIVGNKRLEDIISVSSLIVNGVLNYINIAITLKKDQILDNCLSICEELKQYKASSEVEFTMFNGILDRIKSIKLNETQSARYEACLSKSKSSSNKYIAITVIVAIIAIIRLVAAIFN
jgi:hypothetical protein